MKSSVRIAICCAILATAMVRGLSADIPQSSLATATGKTSTRPKPSPIPKVFLNATSARAQSFRGWSMPKISPPVRPALRLLAILASTGLLAYLVWQAGPGKLWHNLVSLGWGFTLVIVLAGVSHFARTWAWHMTLGNGRHKLSFPKLVGLRLGAEAARQLGIVV